jgi:hypothetical protein
MLHPLTSGLSLCEQILQEEKLELGELGLTGSGPFSCSNPFRLSSFDEPLREAKAEEVTGRGSGAMGSGGSGGGGGAGGVGLRAGASPEVAGPKPAGRPGSRGGGSKGGRAAKR